MSNFRIYYVTSPGDSNCHFYLFCSFFFTYKTKRDRIVGLYSTEACGSILLPQGKTNRTLRRVYKFIYVFLTCVMFYRIIPTHESFEDANNCNTPISNL